MEKRWYDLTSANRKENRQSILIKVLVAFYSGLESLGQLSKTKLGKAVDYVLNQHDALAVVLTDGCLEIYDNRAERAIKEFVMGTLRTGSFPPVLKVPRQVASFSASCGPPTLMGWTRGLI